MLSLCLEIHPTRATSHYLGNPKNLAARQLG